MAIGLYNSEENSSLTLSASVADILYTLDPSPRLSGTVVVYGSLTKMGGFSFLIILILTSASATCDWTAVSNAVTLNCVK